MLVNLLRINSILVGIVGSTMSLPLIVSIVYKEGNQLLFSYLGPIVVSIIVLLAVNLPLRKRKIDLSIRSSYMIVASAWIFAPKLLPTPCLKA